MGNSWDVTANESEPNPSFAFDKVFGSRLHSEQLTKARDKVEYVLLVEDNPGDVILVREALKAQGIDTELMVITDGERALHFVDTLDTNTSVDCPSIIILDLNLPKKSGHEVIRRIRASERIRNTPVAVLSSSDAASDRREAALMNVAHYIRKPSDLDQFLSIGKIISSMLRDKE